MELSRLAPAPVADVDVLIVGAGLSGIGAAVHLRRRCPGRTFAIVEAREAIGGTWDLFRYPGIRSDSDMFTLGYSFKPWEQAEAIADGEAIRSYVREAATENDIERHITFATRAVRAEWSSQDCVWTVQLEDLPSGERWELRCHFLLGCTGYYRYDEGYKPHFEGIERFAGEVVHPQHWPEDLQYSGKRVLVIGSGATAVTLVPAMARTAAHVTMLQRSPSYVLAVPGRDPIGELARRWLPRQAAYSVMRWKNVLMAMALFKLSRRAPALMRGLLRRGTQSRLPPGYDVDTHFNPSYAPWDQRMCFVPDGDMFDAISAGKASVVTDRIDTFTERGVRLAGGGELDADIVVTATGLNLLALGGIELAVDGREIALNETVAYKGMMLSDVPNLALTLGYTNASWTLKADLVSEYVCRILEHMSANGYTRCMPRTPDASVETEPFMDLKSGYVLRALPDLPRQGSRTPWRLNQNYVLDVRLLRRGPLEDEAIEFSALPPLPAVVRPAATPAAA